MRSQENSSTSDRTTGGGTTDTVLRPKRPAPGAPTCRSRKSRQAGKSRRPGTMFCSIAADAADGSSVGRQSESKRKPRGHVSRNPDGCTQRSPHRPLTRQLKGSVTLRLGGCSGRGRYRSISRCSMSVKRTSSSRQGDGQVPDAVLVRGADGCGAAEAGAGVDDDAAGRRCLLADLGPDLRLPPLPHLVLQTCGEAGAGLLDLTLDVPFHGDRRSFRDPGRGEGRHRPVRDGWPTACRGGAASGTNRGVKLVLRTCVPPGKCVARHVGI